MCLVWSEHREDSQRGEKALSLRPPLAMIRQEPTGGLEQMS